MASRRVKAPPIFDVLEPRTLLSVTLAWAAKWGEQKSNRGECVAADGAGGAYVAGISESNAYRDSRVVLARYSARGKQVWSHALGTDGATDSVNALAVDPKGNLLVSVRLGGSVDLDPGAATRRAGTVGISRDYVLKLTADANLIWAGEFSPNARVRDLSLDAIGNPHLIGTFSGSADLNPAAGKAVFTSRGGDDAFVEQISVNGKLVWAGTMGSALVPRHTYDPGDSGRRIVVDAGSGDVFVGGVFAGKGDFDPDPARAFPLTSAGGEDIFVARLNSAGVRVWATRVGGAGNDSIDDLSVDRARRTVLSGRFEGSIDLDPGAGVRRLREDGGRHFIMRLGGDAALGWARQLDLGWAVQRVSLAVGVDNGIYATGAFNHAVDFDPGPGEFVLRSWSGDLGLHPDDIFALRLSPGGVFMDAARFGRDRWDNGSDIAADLAGRVFVTGRFGERVDFDPGLGVFALTATHDWDAFVMRLWT